MIRSQTSAAPVVATAFAALLLAATPHAALGMPWAPAANGCSQSPPGPGTFIMMNNTAANSPTCACVVTLQPSQTLKLNHHMIACGGAVTGVCISGAGEQLKGPGVIQGCTTGVSIAVISSGALVDKVQIVNNTIGISDSASPSPSKLIYNVVDGNTAEGIELGAALAIVKANHVAANPVGISVSSGIATIENNYVLSNTGDGISVASSTPGTLIQNNYVVGNSGDGIVLAATNTGTTVTLNEVTANSGDGIDVASGATGCRMLKNIAHVNTLDDLFDGNAACGGNQWLADIFETDNQSCAS